MTTHPATTSAPVRVLIVDDSALVRQVLSRELSRDPQIAVVGVACDAYSAREKIVALRPDVITLDIQMPRMDGISFLRRLMQYQPMPVIIVSGLAAEGASAAIEAMSAGAVDVVSKPAPGESVERLCAGLAEKIKAVAHAHVGRLPMSPRKRPAPQTATRSIAEKLLVLGASTGGVKALTEIIASFDSRTPPILVVQHMPPVFTASFAQRLDLVSAVRVAEARDGDEVLAGHVLIAPGGFHMLLRRRGTGYFVQVKDGPKVCHQRPSVDVLFQSVAQAAGVNAVGALLTGMGNDGAEGLLAMRKAGARTMAQDEHTSVVFGMPAEAIRNGAAEQVVPSDQIASAMLSMAGSQQTGARILQREQL